MTYIYIVVDHGKGTQRAHKTLRQARFGSLGIPDGKIVRASINTDLLSEDMRVALFNREGYATKEDTVALIKGGIPRKVPGV